MFFENRLFMKIKNVKQRIINKYNIYIVIFLGRRVKKESGVHFVRYENLRESPFAELKKTLDYLEVNKTDTSITKAIENQSILKMQAREKVKDERQRFARKGIVGDWKSNFNSNSKDLAKSELGDILIEMGYEKDKNW
jgi:hypothetical protein